MRNLKNENSVYEWGEYACVHVCVYVVHCSIILRSKVKPKLNFCTHLPPLLLSPYFTYKQHLSLQAQLKPNNSVPPRITFNFSCKFYGIVSSHLIYIIIMPISSYFIPPPYQMMFLREYFLMFFHI